MEEQQFAFYGPTACSHGPARRNEEGGRRQQRLFFYYYKNYYYSTAVPPHDFEAGGCSLESLSKQQRARACTGHAGEQTNCWPKWPGLSHSLAPSNAHVVAYTAVVVRNFAIVTVASPPPPSHTHTHMNPPTLAYATQQHMPVIRVMSKPSSSPSSLSGRQPRAA